MAKSLKSSKNKQKALIPDYFFQYIAMRMRSEKIVEAVDIFKNTQLQIVK